MKKWIVLLISLLCLAACSRVPVPEEPRYKAVDAATVVRMHLLYTVDRGVLPLVKVKLGQESGWWLLDTGSSHNLVSIDLARRLQLSVVSSSTIATIGGRQISTHHRLPLMQIGKLKLEGQSASAVDLSGLSVKDAYQVDGVIGMPALQNLVLGLDYRNRTLRFSGGRLSTPNSKQTIIPFQLKNGVPVARLTLHGNRRGDFILDTGNATALVVLPSLPLQKREQPLHFIEVSDLGGSIPTQLASLQQLSVGAKKFRQIPVSLPLSGFHAPGVDGSLGNTLLAQQEVVFDFPQRQLALRHNVQPPSWQAGDFGFLLAQDNIISVINTNSPADNAGLQRGDRVVAVNGQNTLTASSHTIWRLLSTWNAARLAVMRGDQRLAVEIQRAQYLPEVE